MGITTDRLPFLPDPTLGEEWAIKKARLGGRVNHKEQRVAFTELQGNKLLEANDQVAEGRFAVGQFGLGMGSQALLRGLDVVHQVGQLLQRRRSPGALAQEVIELLESALGYDHTAILLVDRATRQLKPFALSEKAYGRDFSQAYEEYVATHDLRLGAGAAGWVAYHGQAILCGDTHCEALFKDLKSEMRSILFVPIRVEAVVIGAIGTESRLIDAFTPLDQQLLEVVADQVAIAIQNAHLFSRMRQEEMQPAAAERPQHGNGEETGTFRNSAPTELATAGGQIQPAPLPMASPEESEELISELRARIEELDAFNHTVAHDLKNPLSILLGFADVLAHDYAASEDELLVQGIRVILENAQRMENIINELLLLAEVRTVEQIPLEALDMSAVVEETRGRLSNFIRDYDAQIEAPDSWPKALGHQPWVEEIWVNYLTNAIRYGGPSPRVKLGGEVSDEGMARFWIRDFGQGISAADQQRLFIPFTKLQQANTKGHGLGLSIVQRITKRLGGTVGVESELGEGSLFWFTLPLADDR